MLTIISRVPACEKLFIYSVLLIYRFSRKWRKQSKVRKREIWKTTFLTKKCRTLSFASWQNFASIENMTFRCLKCVHGPRQLHCAHRKMLLTFSKERRNEQKICHHPCFTIHVVFNWQFFTSLKPDY
jgi:hypothetical protein